MIPSKYIWMLVAAALSLPATIVIVAAVARLLAALNDEAGAAWLDRTALALGILWVIDLVGLLVVQSIASLGPPTDRDGDE